MTSRDDRIADFMGSLTVRCERCHDPKRQVSHVINCSQSAGDYAGQHPELFTSHRLCTECWKDYLRIIDKQGLEKVGLR